MKLSPYYKVFEDDALVWEEKLNRVSALFDVWIDVQRRWVYLEGIFAGSADIKHLLPVETNRFQTISSEFLALMRKVYKSPLVVDVLAIPNVQKNLERLADLLGKIQKALGEYLERERSRFPRFYFVGDEDLLEIIGNSKDVTKVQKHAQDVAGIHHVLLSPEGDVIRGMASRRARGALQEPVDVGRHRASTSGSRSSSRRCARRSRRSWASRWGLERAGAMGRAAPAAFDIASYVRGWTGTRRS